MEVSEDSCEHPKTQSPTKLTVTKLYCTVRRAFVAPEQTFYQLANQRVRIYLTGSLTRLLAFSTRSKYDLLTVCRLFTAQYFFVDLSGSSPLIRVRRPLVSSAPWGRALGFVAAGEKGGEKKETVLTSLLLTIKEGVVPATQACD